MSNASNFLDFLFMDVFLFGSIRMFLDVRCQHKHQPLHDNINPKDCQVASPLVIQGFSNFLGLFQVMTRQTPDQRVS